MTLNTQDGEAQVSLVLDMAETPALLSRGLARDITRRVQARRKALDLAIEATISLQVWTTNAPDLAAEDRQYIASETRAAEAVFHDEGDAPAEAKASRWTAPRSTCLSSRPERARGQPGPEFDWRPCSTLAWA